MGKLRRSLKISEGQWLLVSSVFVGAAAGLAAFFFSSLIHYFHHLFFEIALSPFGGAGKYLVIVVPALGGLLIGPIVTFVSPEAKGHGVPEVMYAVARRDGRIRPIVAAAKSIASSICIGSGGSVGKEGPIVQIGSAMGSSIAQLFRMPSELTKMLVACGAAGGIAATFGTPIAGVMFAMEVILNDFTARAFSMVVISAVTATAVAGVTLGRAAFFQTPEYDLVSPWELLFYAALGILAAVCARIFVKILYASEDWFEKLPIPEYLKPALGGLALGVIGFFLPQVFGTGHEITEAALWGQLTVGLLVVLFLFKMAASSLTLGSGGSGGVFSPSLFIGAMLGGGVGHLIHSQFPRITADSGAYAMVGMAAFFAGATRAPITAIVILFEMTHDYRIILPVMIASVASTLVSARLSRDTIYTLKLRRRGIDIEVEREAGVLASMRVADVMTRDVETASESSSLDDLIKQMGSSRHSGFPVVNGKNELIGMVTAQQVYEALPLRHELGKVIVVKEVMTSRPQVAHPDERLDEIVRKLHLSETDHLPVLERAERGSPGKLVGIITHADVMKAYRKLLEQARESHQTAGFTGMGL
ncbi:MAG TPA: chloride channel protein [bacterium]|nr:chloride channel protein [bacterium]